MFSLKIYEFELETIKLDFPSLVGGAVLEKKEKVLEFYSLI